MTDQFEQSLYDQKTHDQALEHQERMIAIMNESVDRQLLIAREGLRLEGWTDTAVKICTDGTDEKGVPMWSAMIGPNIQEGFCGFHVDKLTAKELLLADIQKPHHMPNK